MYVVPRSTFTAIALESGLQVKAISGSRRSMRCGWGMGHTIAGRNIDNVFWFGVPPDINNNTVCHCADLCKLLCNYRLSILLDTRWYVPLTCLEGQRRVLVARDRRGRFGAGPCIVIRMSPSMDRY